MSFLQAGGAAGGGEERGLHTVGLPGTDGSDYEVWFAERLIHLVRSRTAAELWLRRLFLFGRFRRAAGLRYPFESLFS